MDFLRDIWGFLAERKKFWLLPAIVILLVVGVAVIVAGTSVIAPFVNTLF